MCFKEIIKYLIIMCGILCVHGLHGYVNSKLLMHRGPDSTKVTKLGKCIMVFNRLCINDISESGQQPFMHGNQMLVCNGEIFNHKTFACNRLSSSDCECLLPLIQKDGFFSAMQQISGEFAICMTDGDRLMASRDHMGIRPLFYTKYDGGIAMASEVKALLNYDTPIQIFPPGHIYDSYSDQFSCWYPGFWDCSVLTPQSSIKDAFIQSVKDRVTNSDRPLAFLLSGGLDSSLVVSVAKSVGCQNMKTFSVGTKDSPDCKAARRVSEYLNTDHTEVYFDVAEGIKNLEEVIWSIESYDTTTVRASVPMWSLARHISQTTDCKVILSGEGSDELFGGYLYFHGAPSVDHFSSENTRRLRLIHQFDGLRADRCIAAHGLELRVPFLDKHFIDVGMTIDQSLKLPKDGVEKWVLRDAFKGDYLPDDILWRQKNGMSDAVGYSWVSEVKKHAEETISDDQFETIKFEAQGHNVPLTKEEALYRLIFWKKFGHDDDHLISEIWRPRWTNETDPSATKLKNFVF